MKKILIIMTLIISTLLTNNAYANDMINNSAIGTVNGNIYQQATNNSNNEINVGSIINYSNKSVKNISVKGHVNGNISLISNNNSVRMNVATYIQR